MLQKLIAIYSCMIEDKPLLEEHIGRFVCEQLFKSNKNFNDLALNKLTDNDHKDLSKMSDIILKILRVGLDANEKDDFKYLVFSRQVVDS